MFYRGVAAIIGFALKRSLADRNYPHTERDAPATVVSLCARVNQSLGPSISLIPNSDIEVFGRSRRFAHRLPCRTFLPRDEVIERCYDKYPLDGFPPAPWTAPFQRPMPFTPARRRSRVSSAGLAAHAQVYGAEFGKGSGSIGADPSQKRRSSQMVDQVLGRNARDRTRTVHAVRISAGPRTSPCSACSRPASSSWARCSIVSPTTSLAVVRAASLRQRPWVR